MKLSQSSPSLSPPLSPSVRSPLRRHLTILGLYTALTLLLTWPLVRHFTTHVPGVAQWAFDESTFLWNIWYFKHALVDQLSSPLHTELIWYPLGIDLILYTYNFFHALLAQPAMLAVNLPFGSNLALVISTILSSYGVFLLVRYLLGPSGSGLSCLTPGASLLAAFGAGLLYAFGSNRAIYATLGHYDMVTTQWIPFYALALLRALDGGLSPRRRRQAALWAGLFMALNGLAEMITALFLAIFTVIVLLVILTSRRSQPSGAPRPSLLSIALALVLAAVAAVVIWSPALVPILTQFLTNDFSLSGWGEAIPLSVDLFGFFKPTVLHPLWGSDLVAELRRVQLRALEAGVTGFRDINTVFLGWTAMTLALLALIRYRRRVKLWGWTALVFGLFCLGPFLQINGRYRFDLDGVEATFPLPFALLHYLPIIKANRAPNRNSVLLMLALAVLVGYALAWLLQTRRGQETVNFIRRPQVWLAGLLCGLLLFEHLALPLPLSDARIPEVYQTIAPDPAPVSVLQVPLGWRNSFGVFGPEMTLLQYYQTAHGKPMLGGNISRAPDFKMGYFERIPFFAVMRDIQFGDDPDPVLVTEAQAQAEQLVYLYNTGYVLLFPPIPNRPPYVDHWQESWAFVKETLPLEAEPFWAQDGVEAYRVVQPAGEDAFTLDLGVPGTYPYRGEGWDALEVDSPGDPLVRTHIPGEAAAIWATATQSRLFIPLRQVDTAATYEVTMQVHPYLYPDSPQQSVTLGVNDEQLTTQPLAGEWQTLAWQLPGSALADGLNRLELTWDDAAIPRQVLGGDRAIGTTGVQLPIDTDITAFADGGYIALFDEEEEQSDGSAGRRGINVTVIDPATGEVLDKAGFDTTANSHESDALANYLAALPAGQMILVASYGDAWSHLTAEAVTQLQGFGIEVTLEAMEGNYLAAVGVQGAAPGSGAWVLHESNAFLRISLVRDRRTLAAAVDWVKVEQAQ
ncbi:MAG: hypothetical protein IT328_01990 [Caldilineaceae bacterium]|nr:hypothetical protein [Caldilineaceae bacterium]